MSEQSKLLEELRHHEREYPSLVHGPLCGQAADEIASLRAQLASARKALEETLADLKGRSVTQKRIMYVCSDCADNEPEGCGHYDRNDLRVMPDGRWLCEACFDDTTQTERGNLDVEVYVSWHNLVAAPEFSLKTAQGKQE